MAAITGPGRDEWLRRLEAAAAEVEVGPSTNPDAVLSPSKDGRVHKRKKQDRKRRPYSRSQDECTLPRDVLTTDHMMDDLNAAVNEWGSGDIYKQAVEMNLQFIHLMWFILNGTVFSRQLVLIQRVLAMTMGDMAIEIDQSQLRLFPSKARWKDSQAAMGTTTTQIRRAAERLVDLYSDQKLSVSPEDGTIVGREALRVKPDMIPFFRALTPNADAADASERRTRSYAPSADEGLAPDNAPTIPPDRLQINADDPASSTVPMAAPYASPDTPIYASQAVGSAFDGADGGSGDMCSISERLVTQLQLIYQFYELYMKRLLDGKLKASNDLEFLQRSLQYMLQHATRAKLNPRSPMHVLERHRKVVVNGYQMIDAQVNEAMWWVNVFNEFVAQLTQIQEVQDRYSYDGSDMAQLHKRIARVVEIVREEIGLEDNYLPTVNLVSVQVGLVPQIELRTIDPRKLTDLLGIVPSTICRIKDPKFLYTTDFGTVPSSP